MREERESGEPLKDDQTLLLEAAERMRSKRNKLTLHMEREAVEWFRKEVETKHGEGEWLYWEQNVNFGGIEGFPPSPLESDAPESDTLAKYTRFDHENVPGLNVGEEVVIYNRFDPTLPQEQRERSDRGTDALAYNMGQLLADVRLLFAKGWPKQAESGESQ